MEIIIKITIDGSEVKVETEKVTTPVAEMTNHTPANTLGSLTKHAWVGLKIQNII